MSRRTFIGLSAASALALGAGCARAPQHSTVIVIGAGLAGLSAADRLSAQGIDYTVLEARGRPGGRILTLDDVSCQPDAGGLQIGPAYAHLRYLAEKYNVDLEDFPRVKRQFSFGVGEHVLSAQEWAASSANRLNKSEKMLPPSRLLGHYVNPDILPDLDAWRQSDFHHLDVPLSQWLREQGASPQAQELIAANIGAHSLDDISLINELRKSRITQHEIQFGRSQRVSGGTSRLIEAMSAELSSSLVLDSAVTRISRQRGHILVETQNGQRRSCDYLLIAVPFSTLRSIELDIDLPSAWRGVVEDLPYLPVTHIFVRPKNEFWQDDGLGTDLWTDGPLERIFSLDNRRDEQIGLFWCLLNGAAATRFDALSSQDQVELVHKEWQRLRPASEGNIEIERIHSWGQQVYSGGAWSYWRPGQVSQVGETLPLSSGRIFFAGEHLARLGFGMEGACETGTQAALDILDQIL